MLEELRIRGLGVIEDAVVELAPGLTVLTGETGAGKTMIVHGLALLLGGRADAGRVRPGSGSAMLEGRLAVDPTGPAAARARSAGARLDDDVLLVTRSLSAEGRSRAAVGGVAVPVGLLAELAADLVAMHGQFDSSALLRPGAQRAALDRYAGDPVTGPLARYTAAYSRLRAVDAALAELSALGSYRAAEAEELRSGLTDVAAVAPVAGEDTALAAEVDRLAHADALLRSAGAAHGLLAGDPMVQEVDAASLLAAARRALEPAAGHDPALELLSQRVAELGHLLTDVATDLAAYAASVEADPGRLVTAQDRQALLATLTRRHGPDLDAVLSWAAGAADRLAALEGADDERSGLTAERDQLLGMLRAEAAVLTAARTAAAGRFAAAVSAELADLALPQARLTVAVDPSTAGVDGAAFGPTGVDRVEMLLAPHPGSPPLPLGRGASGGERSRVMLAVEVVLAGADPIATMVFDEVDAGIGGRAAVEVGRRLARLARTAQVLVVTHLPQVAAFADRHLRVDKCGDGSVTSSDVTALDDAGRVVELSRMLAGLEDSPLARGHAEELLAAAAATKTGPEPSRRPVLAD